MASSLSLIHISKITDPSTWNDAGKTIMEALEKQYAPYGMTLQAKEGTPYFLAVNLSLIHISCGALHCCAGAEHRHFCAVLPGV